MRRLLLFVALSGCWNAEMNANDGQLGQLSLEGHDVSSAGVPVRLRIYRKDAGTYRCSSGYIGPSVPAGTSCTFIDTPIAVTRVTNASCAEDHCTARIVDETFVEVVGNVAGDAVLRVSAEMDDGSILTDAFALFFNPW